MRDFLTSFVAYPFIHENRLYDGTRFAQFGLCRKCTARDCTNLIGESFSHRTCSKGFSCYPIKVGALQFILNGLIAIEHNNTFSGERRRLYKCNALSESEINAFYKNIHLAFKFIEEERNQAVKDSLAYFHDIRSSVGVVLSSVQEIIDNVPGSSFEEKLNNADENTIGLFQSVNLLEGQLDLADIIANPQSVTYGHKYTSSLYGFLHKMVKLFQPKALKRGIRIEMKGHSYANVSTYNSFQFLPLILLDNAVKYSFPDSSICIYIEDKASRIITTVSSYGNIVTDENRERIFEKYFRTDAAIKYASRGMGVGLYLAKLIAEAHKFTVEYEAHSDDGKNGFNRFSFSLPRA